MNLLLKMYVTPKTEREIDKLILGDTGYHILAAIGAIVIVIALIQHYRKKRKKKQDN